MSGLTRKNLQNQHPTIKIWKLNFLKILYLLCKIGETLFSLFILEPIRLDRWETTMTGPGEGENVRGGDGDDIFFNGGEGVEGGLFSEDEDDDEAWEGGEIGGVSKTH